MASTGIHNGLQPIGEKSRKVGWGVMICRAQAMLDGADDMLVGFRAQSGTAKAGVACTALLACMEMEKAAADREWIGSWPARVHDFLCSAACMP